MASQTAFAPKSQTAPRNRGEENQVEQKTEGVFFYFNPLLLFNFGYLD